MLDSKLWYDILGIVSEWATDHPDLFLDYLVDDIHDYILEEYGPPF